MLNVAHLMNQAERQINNKEQKMRNYKVLSFKWGGEPVYSTHLAVVHSLICKIPPLIFSIADQ